MRKFIVINLYMRYLKVKSKIFLMYLRGLRGHFENHNATINKRRMRITLSILSSLYMYGWISHNWL